MAASLLSLIRIMPVYADAGSTDGMFNLGLAYGHREGVAQDYVKAREWFQKAADGGDAIGMNDLGVLYENGLGVARDYEKAREWYQKAADNGIANAKQALSRLDSTQHP
jgi:TPR repeat protein